MKKYLILLIIAITFMACDDAILDKYPKDKLSADSFWKSKQDADQFLVGLYEALPEELIGDEVMSDNAVHGIKWAEGDVAKGVYNVEDSKFSDQWESSYKNIRKCHVLLENLEKIPSLVPADKDEIIAQAKFFRAYFYFELIKVFGDVPLLKKTITILESQSVKRTPVNEVITFVREDLAEAAAKLPTSWGTSDYGKITKGAALSMKARIEIFYSRWADAALTSKLVMDLGEYELFDKDNTGKYAELFYANKPGSPQKKEMIIERQCKKDVTGNWFNTFYAPPGFGWGGINPTQSFVDEFECTDGKKISKSSLYDDSKPFENRDSRLEVCVLHHGEVFKGKTINTRPLTSDAPTGIGTNNDATATGYYQSKFLNPREETKGVDKWQSDLDWPVFRFAEILLIYAEASNEVSGPNSDIYAAVNRVRKRVGQPDLPSGLSKDEMRIRIRREWRVEFGMEGSRWLDIRRWDIGSKVLNAHFQGMKYDKDTKTAFVGANVIVGIARKYQDQNRLWPIPYTQIELNSNLKPTNGYN